MKRNRDIIVARQSDGSRTETQRGMPICATHGRSWCLRGFCFAACLLLATVKTGFALKPSLIWLQDIRFIAYSPSTFDPRPEHRRLPEPGEIRRDLETVRPYFDGLVLYSANTPSDEVLRIAKDLRFRGVVLGVWDVRAETELQAAVELARQYPELIKAISLGNEGLTFGRYTHDQLAASFVWMRERLPEMPLTTSEPIAQYGDTELQDLPDFHAPNIHPVFDFGRDDPDGAAAWTIERADAIREVTGKPVLCKETGWPSGGDERFSPKSQRTFWQALQTQIQRNPYPSLTFVFFEAFDLPWKAEASGMASEGHWGFWKSDRKPKDVVGVLRR
jgi:exo-beta-1,3-glucanase (GH17 family)